MDRHVESLEPRRLLAGLTVLSHGYQGDVNGWVNIAANAIAGRAGGLDDVARYILKIRTNADGKLIAESNDLITGSPKFESTSSGEAIIEVDWSKVSSGDFSTGAVGSVVAEYLISPLKGGRRWSDLPMHFIGHSRGASLNVALAERLGEHGIWVDQNTFLDPHPVDGHNDIFDVDFGDTGMRVSDNVVFADDYWRTDGNADDLDPDGEPVGGSHIVDLNPTVQADFVASAHLSVPNYYYATIDTSVDGSDSPLFFKNSWFDDSAEKPARGATGFAFSRIAREARPADGLSTTHGGSAARTETSLKGVQWGDVDELKLSGSASDIPAGQWLRVSMHYQDRDGGSSVELYLDRDGNPYNGNSVTRFARKAFPKSAGVTSIRLSGTTAEASAGTYFVYAKVVDAAGMARYDYLKESIELVAPSDDLKFASVENGALSVGGTTRGDRIYVTSDGTTMSVTRDDFTQMFAASTVSSITIDAGAGGDSIVLGSGVPGVLALGGSGDDTLRGGDGNDTLAGGIGKDRLYGGAGADRLLGAGGNDALFGEGGADRIYGESGNDYLDGGASNDHLFGGSGVDTLIGGSGTDSTDQDPLDILQSI